MKVGGVTGLMPPALRAGLTGAVLGMAISLLLRYGAPVGTSNGLGLFTVLVQGAGGKGQSVGQTIAGFVALAAAEVLKVDVQMPAGIAFEAVAKYVL